MMRGYLAENPEEEPRIFRMLDLISRGAQGHGPVNLLLISAGELGFAWDGAEKGWVRVSLPLLRMMSGPVQHFYSSILDPWRYVIFAKLSERKGFWVVSIPIFKALDNYLHRPTCGNEKNVVTSHFVWGCLERISSWQGQERWCFLSFLW